MHRSIALLVATFTLSAVFALAPDNPATIKPADRFTQQGPPTTTAAVTQTTTTATTSNPTTTHNSTTANVTTSEPTTTTHNSTTANVTTSEPTTATHNSTTANVTTSEPTTATHNSTTANVTTSEPTMDPNTTTHVPTTHNTTDNVTTATPPTTPGPTPPANATQGNYTIIKDKKLCVMIQSVIEINVNNSQAAGTFIVQPSKTSTQGNCNTNSAHIEILFDEGHVNMELSKDNDTKMVYVKTLSLNLNYAFKIGNINNFTQNNDSLKLFAVAAGLSYSCSSDLVFMGNGIHLNFTQLRSQAFDFTSNQFGQPDLCKADQPDYRVAIAVGVVLIILIVMVVACYLISRKKRTDGYQSL